MTVEGIRSNQGERKELYNRADHLWKVVCAMKVSSRDMAENKGQKIRGCKAIENVEGQDKNFKLDMGVHWKDMKRGQVT